MKSHFIGRLEMIMDVAMVAMKAISSRVGTWLACSRWVRQNPKYPSSASVQKMCATKLDVQAQRSNFPIWLQRLTPPYSVSFKVWRAWVLGELFASCANFIFSIWCLIDVVRNSSSALITLSAGIAVALMAASTIRRVFFSMGSEASAPTSTLNSESEAAR
jgi:hypothetical protein